MESYNNLSETELLDKIRISERDHEALKQEMLKLTYIIEEHEKLYNERIEKLEVIEKEYVDLMKELSIRK